MPRTKKTKTDHELNTYIGKKVASFRIDEGFTLSELAEKIGISVPHIKSLESGRYNFSAALLSNLAKKLNRPIEAFFPDKNYRPNESEKKMWDDLYASLPARERRALLEVGQKLAAWSDDIILQFWRRGGSKRRFLVSLEGIDGVLMRRQAELLARRINQEVAEGGLDAPQLPRSATVCWYNYNSALWRFMFERFDQIKRGAPGNYSGAFERTLLFACERLHRQETQIRPALDREQLVITPFFCLAPRVYQYMEGLKDPTVVKAVANFLIVPDLVLVLRSDPEKASRRATLGHPGPDRFFSPYELFQDFKDAGTAHEELKETFQPRDMQVVFVDGADAEQADGEEALAEELYQLVKAAATTVFA